MANDQERLADISDAHHEGFGAGVAWADQTPAPVTHLSTTHHFDDETIDRLAAKDRPSRCAMALCGSQPHRRTNVDKLIEDAGVLARWLEHGWKETP